MVSIHPLIDTSSSLFHRFFEIVPRAPNTISITGTFMFDDFFSSLAKSRYLSSFFFFFFFCSILFEFCDLPEQQNSLVDKFSFSFSLNCDPVFFIWIGESGFFVNFVRLFFKLKLQNLLIDLFVYSLFFN